MMYEEDVDSFCHHILKNLIKQSKAIVQDSWFKNINHNNQFFKKVKKQTNKKR